MGRREGRPKNNVVPLTRDWLGPREELVPFGRSAGGARGRGGGASRDDDVDPEPAAPLNAQDFWTEDSAAIHHALEAPAAVAAERRPRRRLNGARPVVDFPRAVGLRYVALALIVLGSGAVVLDRLEQGPAVRGRASVPPTLLTERFSPPVVEFPTLRSTASARAVRHRAPARPVTRAHGPSATPAATVAAVTPAPPSGVAPVSSVSSQPVVASPSRSPSSYQSQPAAVTHSARPASQSSGAPAGTSPASSQSPPAFGAAGALGPGSSPDS